MESPATVGNYVLCGELAKGGMATIWIGHAVGSTRPLAIKMLSAHGATPELITMFLDELAVATRVRHRNVVETIEVVSSEDDDLCLVMEYVEGETLSKLARAAREKHVWIPVPIAARIVCGALAGLQAVHDATDEHNRPLEIVHRDVSPQNIVLGVDGVARLLDFGVAKAAVRLQQTRTGQLKGKVAYMAPEQLNKNEVTTRSDVYSMGIVLWEALTTQRMFEADTEGQLVHRVMQGPTDPPIALRRDLSRALDDVVMRALALDPADRYPSARHFASAIELATPVASLAETAAWIQGFAQQSLEARARRVGKMLGTLPLDSPSSPSTPSSAPSFARSSGSIPSAAPSGLRPPASSPSAPLSSRPIYTASSSASVPVASSSAGGGAGTGSATGLRGRSHEAAAGTPGASTGVAKAPGKHVLIIDDSPIILENARRALEADGWRVTTTTQTVGAARHLVDCDLALIDYHMPGLNGGDVIRSLRAASASSGRSCLFYLYTSDPEVAKNYMRDGFDGAMTNKGDDTALVRGVRAAFRVLQLRAMKK